MFIIRFNSEYSFKDFIRDSVIGVLIALVSIPISMGYAEVSGLPAVYGLYGSFLPILFYGFFTTSKRFVLGVDAAPAALTGALLVSLGITFGSKEAISLVPLITLLTSFWLFLFFILGFERFLKFISQSVMEGFITGIGLTIILMQAPKLFGGTAGTGEVIELILHIWKELCSVFNFTSLVLGLGTVIILLVFKKFFPKIPMQPVLMILGAFLTYAFNLERFGVKTLPSVEKALPPFAIPDFTVINGNVRTVILSSFTIAVVILSETLLASTNQALKNGEKLNARREILAYAAGNAVSAFSASCPVNGSVSRSAIASQYGVKSQVMSVTASFSMLFILLFGTPFIKFLPVPVLTGIVIAALCGTLEFKLAYNLHKVDKSEFFIFCAALFAVLFLGTIYGVVVGVILASVTFIIRQAKPFSAFLGFSPGVEGFHSLQRKSPKSYPLKGVLLYRFSGPLFYANIEQFVSELEREIKKDTRIVIVDSSGIGNVDVTACNRLLLLYKKLKSKNIKFYLASHVSAVNDELRTLGAATLIEEGAVRSSISGALKAEGFTEPYELENIENITVSTYTKDLAEFEWAFGIDAESRMDKMASELAEQMALTGIVEAKSIIRNECYWSDVDEETFLDLLEKHLARMQENGRLVENKTLEEKIALLHAHVEEKLLTDNKDALKAAVKERLLRDKIFKEKHPKAFEKIVIERERLFGEIAMNHPELAKTLAEIISELEAE